MINFEFYSPTKVIFGKETEQQVGAEIKKWGGSRVLIHYGSASAKKSGLLDRIIESLKAEGLFYAELGGVVPNPRLGKVYEGIELCKKENIDFILAIGGGSVIDSAKAIALGTVNDGDVWDFFLGTRKPGPSVPVGAVLTIAAAGSETSMSCVITKEEGLLKRGLNIDQNRPKFAIMNPELTYTLPHYQTGCGIVDIMMHTMDRYFSNTTATDFTDRISEALLQATVKAGTACIKNPMDYDARANLMWAGSVSHNTLTGMGKVTDFAPHQIEHELSATFDVAHGAGLSAIWGHWARYVYKVNVMKFVQFAVRVWNVEMDFENPELTALEGIEATERFFSSIGMPINIPQLLGKSTTAAEMDEMADKATFRGKRLVGFFKQLEAKDIREIYEAANKE
ncbi:iron-containing alcohol dehydrogenase [Oscillospiraceae bacterium MB08-C2-2]|nr:iron-containing alcohol dehydrogenase [Oscillospiraceae bacterium MB08-C2-2]